MGTLSHGFNANPNIAGIAAFRWGSLCSPQATRSMVFSSRNFATFASSRLRV